mgnify:CR=1 FL=1|tara:strand:+ start:79 stop:402 length:324 start_codon:yes stop_codon:yes gene_type:complete
MKKGYVPQSQMSEEQLSKKAYGSMGMPQVQVMNEFIKRAKMQQMMNMRAAQEAETISKVVRAVDGVVNENIQLKKQMNLQNIQNQKTDIINKGRQKPFELNKKRTGK